MSTYHHGDLRDAALRAAGKMLEKEGIAALSLRQVARKAGVSHNAPYRHFKDRDALLAALAAEGFGLLGKALAEAPRKEMGMAYVRFALGHPQRFRLMFGGMAPLGAEARAAYEALLGAMRADPAIRDAELAAAAAWSLVHGLSHLLLDGHFPQAQAERPKFIDRVLGSVRFVQRSE